MKRSAGILLAVSSLPGAYGVGSLGKEAYRFVDFLVDAGQRLWQILPIGPTSYGDSPYQSFSAFAANPYFIDLEALAAEGLLTQEELAGARCDAASHAVDYAKLYEARYPLLRRAAARFDCAQRGFCDFCTASAAWLPDYALFMALKEENGMRAFSQWPAPLRTRQPDALAQAKARLAGKVRFWQVVQYWFHLQWTQLKSYANAKGVSILGDLPIYVSPDSSDLWAAPALFQVDGACLPLEVAGCPPDAFSEDGQLWGNPLYAWDAHRADGFAWWMRRLRHACTVYDAVRIDHFRGFESYYAIPAGEKTAVHGVWRKGPGMEFIRALREQLPGACIVAEDLGFLTPAVRALLAESGFPGMKVLQFAFDSREESDYLPHNYPHNCVVYTGTHDNTTSADWARSAPAEDVAFARRYLALSAQDAFAPALVRAALSSVADTAIIPLQDWLGLGAEARMNTPSTLGGNWQWRVDETALSPALAKHILAQTQLYGRAARPDAAQREAAANTT